MNANLSSAFWIDWSFFYFVLHVVTSGTGSIVLLGELGLTKWVLIFVGKELKRLHSFSVILPLVSISLLC